MSQVVDLEARAWLPRYCRGDKPAFMQLLEAYRTPVYSYLMRCGVDKATRDDLFQEIFLKIHLGAASYQPSRPLQPWIFTIVVNTVRNHFRNERARQQVFAFQEPPEIPDSRAATDAHAETHQSIGRLEMAIRDLPFSQREVLVLTTIKGFRLNEVAQILEIPLNSVKTYLRRARLTLIECLADRDERAGNKDQNDEDL